VVILNLKIVNKQQSIQTSLLLIIVTTLGMFFSVSNIIPILALHEEEQLLNNYDDLQEFADAVKDGDEQIEDIPLESMEASDIYEDADESLQECIDQAAEVGDSLTDKEVVHCVDNLNYFKNKYPTNSSVPITTTNTATNTTTTGTIASTGTNDTSTSNGISTAEDEGYNLINELVKTGKFTEEEARELVTKVTLINELVKTGKFTEEEGRQLVTKVMNNGTNEVNRTAGVNEVPEVPEANVTAGVNEVPEVPEANVTAGVNEVPEANVTAGVNEVPEVPEANVTAGVNEVPEANVTAGVNEVPEANVTAGVTEVPEANVTAGVPEANVPQDNNSNLVKLDISVKQDPIATGEEQTVTLIASDPTTGEPLGRIFVHLTITDPSGNVLIDYTDNDGQLSPTFIISQDQVGTFTILGTASQAGVESMKSLTFQVQ
jgi:polyhydroxyalkanoate synthesis regulator phasin